MSNTAHISASARMLMSMMCGVVCRSLTRAVKPQELEQSRTVCGVVPLPLQVVVDGSTPQSIFDVLESNLREFIESHPEVPRPCSLHAE